MVASNRCILIWDEQSIGLATDHVQVALRMARRLAEVYFWPVDEAESLAMVELVEAVMAYRDQGHRFTSYLYARLRVAMRQPYWRGVSSVEPDQLDWFPGSPGVSCRSETCETVRAWLADLPSDHRRVLSWRFGIADGHERTLTEIAGKMARTRQWVARIEADALTALRSRIESDQSGPPSIYRGVRKVGTSWVACIRINGQTVSLGTFADPESASRAFQMAATERARMRRRAWRDDRNSDRTRD